GRVALLMKLCLNRVPAGDVGAQALDEHGGTAVGLGQVFGAAQQAFLVFLQLPTDLLAAPRGEQVEVGVACIEQRFVQRLRELNAALPGFRFSGVVAAAVLAVGTALVEGSAQ